MLNVSTEIKAIVEKNAKLVCDKTQTKHDAFNQDLNAYAIARSLKEIGIDWAEEFNGKVLEVLKKGGNASALRQAISGVNKKQDVASNEIVAKLLDM